jgi:septal ring factor EnvC (AmiA/AmiB activator)
MNRLLLSAAVTANLLAALPALAQAPAAPASEARVATRAELHACMDSESDIAKRRQAMNERRRLSGEEAAALRAEAQQLADEQKMIREDEYQKMDRFNRKVKAHNAKLETANATLASIRKDTEAVNQAVNDYNTKCVGMSVKTEDRDAVLKERAAAGK